MNNRYWEKRPYVISEFQVDTRWILREENDQNDPPKAWGSLRIVSHPDLRPGYLKAFATFVTSRRPKTKEEIESSIDEFQMEVTELEIYSVDEHITTQTMDVVDTKRNLEDQFNIKIFG